MNVSTTILAALGAMICWGFGDFIIQKGVRKIGNIETLAWIGLLGSLGLFAVIDVILEAELPIAVLLGAFFFGEFLTITQTFLVFLIFVGVVLIATEPEEIKKRHFLEKGAMLALVAAIGYGLIDFLTAVGAKTVSPILTIWFTWTTFTIMCLFYIGAHRGGLRHFFADALKYKWLVLSMSVIDTAAWILFAIAVKHNDLAVTVAITESYPAIGLLLGIVINKEKVKAHQYVGATIAVVASFAMGFFIT